MEMLLARARPVALHGGAAMVAPAVQGLAVAVAAAAQGLGPAGAACMCVAEGAGKATWRRRARRHPNARGRRSADEGSCRGFWSG
mgnify:CR=1 FL=1